MPLVELVLASNDASFCRYFRWQGGDCNLVMMDAPPPQEDYRPFVKVTGPLAGAGVYAPRILAQDPGNGFLLSSDLGQQTYLDMLHLGNADELLGPALDALIASQKVDITSVLLVYDEAVLHREPQLFPDWYLARHLGVELEDKTLAHWQWICDLPVRNTLEQPRVLVRCNHMPRNLILSKPSPGALDFQDVLHGPIAYDVTYLYKDIFVSRPESHVHAALSHYWKKAIWAGIPLPPSFEDFLCVSGLMGVRRHLKVIGILARICHRDGKPRYLGDVPRFFRYLETAVAYRPELAKLGELLTSLPQGAEA